MINIYDILLEVLTETQLLRQVEQDSIFKLSKKRETILMNMKNELDNDQ